MGENIVYWPVYKTLWLVNQVFYAGGLDQLNWKISIRQVLDC